MGTIYQPESQKVRLLQSEKTSFPTLLHLPDGVEGTSVKQGEWVKLASAAGGTKQLAKFDDQADCNTNAATALMRINTTTNDVLESGAISAQKGFYELATQLYQSGQSYSAGDELALYYDATVGGAVLGPVIGDSTHAVAIVDVPPSDASANTFMQVTVFPPRPKAA